jgi:hypothetical protein
VGHDHHHDDNYYVDQLCMIALCGAYGVIAVSLYFWNRQMLNLLVGPQFHLYVLWGGLALIVMVLTRAAVLWISVGRKAQTASALHLHDHGHEHHHHDHGHEHHHHDHGHEHHHHTHAIVEGHPPHDHDHDHNHGHAHNDGHSHDSAPWRYVVMLVPVLLFLLGLPSKAPGVGRVHTKIDTTEDAQHYAGALLAGGPDVLNTLGVAAALMSEEAMGTAIEMDCKQLESAATVPQARETLKGKTVRVRGQFAPSNDRVFSLVRFRIQCCAADRIRINVPMISKNSLNDLKIPLKENDWVEVTAKVDFRMAPGDRNYTTVLLVPQLRYIRPCDPDPSVWLQ